MSFPNLQLTDAGRSIIVAALAGGNILFKAIGVGNGNKPSNVNAITELSNPIKKLGIGEIKTGNGCANLTAVLDNANLVEGFWWRELGIYAEDTNGNDVLYAYAYAGNYADYIPAYSNTSYLKTTMNVTVVVGDAEHVDAVLNEYVGYVTTETYEEHLRAENPHNVTKEQVGLGEVDNVAFLDQEIGFQASGATLGPISVGMKLTEFFRKVYMAIESLIAHLRAVNPHNITPNGIGAAADVHTHDAGDINSGVLPILRGGTGGSTAAAARVSLGINSLYKLFAYISPIINFPAGGYVEGTVPITVYSGYKAVAVAGWSIINDGTTGSHDKYVTTNNIEIRDSYVTYHLYNTSNSANHVKLNVQVLYIRNT